MTRKRPKADVVIVGLGWCGSLAAEELTRAGLDVVAIERGPWVEPAIDFAPGVDTDELRWDTRRSMLLPPAIETTTVRNTRFQKALPIRDWSINEWGYNAGGSGTHWAAMAWRFTPFDFQPYSMTVSRYGAKQLAEGLIVQDWGVTYDELEPYYDRFEKIAGISGKAGVLNGQIMQGGNPFEGSRSSEYPLPPLKTTHLTDLSPKPVMHSVIILSWYLQATRQKLIPTPWAYVWRPVPIAVTACITAVATGRNPARMPVSFRLWYKEAILQFSPTQLF